MNLDEIKNIETINQMLNKLFEGVLDMPEGTELEQQMEILSSRMITAKKMLGLTNKLTNPEEKKKHRSRVLGLINQIRAGLKRLSNQLATEE